MSISRPARLWVLKLARAAIPRRVHETCELIFPGSVTCLCSNLQSAMIFRYIFVADLGYGVADTQKPAASVWSCMGRCTPQDLPLVCSSADQAKGASPCKIGSLVEIPAAI